MSSSSDSASIPLPAAFSLEGRTAVLTGAASGIGRQGAITFAQAGALVVLADRNRDGLAETAELIEGGGGRALIVPTDVSVRTEVEHLAGVALRDLGRLDIWVNAAGIIRNALVVDVEETDLDAVLGVNLKGVLWGCSAAGRVMSAAGHGAVINISSAGGEVGSPTLAYYGMAKAAVIQLTRILAAELGPKGVRANAIAPGFIETPMTRRTFVAEDGTVDEARGAELFASVAARSPLGITGDPVDIAWAMLYLACDASRFITGAVIRANGGVHMP